MAASLACNLHGSRVRHARQLQARMRGRLSYLLRRRGGCPRIAHLLSRKRHRRGYRYLRAATVNGFCHDTLGRPVSCPDTARPGSHLGGCMSAAQPSPAKQFKQADPITGRRRACARHYCSLVVKRVNQALRHLAWWSEGCGMSFSKRAHRRRHCVVSALAECNLRNRYDR